MKKTKSKHSKCRNNLHNSDKLHWLYESRSRSNSVFQIVLRVPPLAGPNVKLIPGVPRLLPAFLCGSGEVIRVKLLIWAHDPMHTDINIIPGQGQSFTCRRNASDQGELGPGGCAHKQAHFLMAPYNVPILLS